ncbi:MAG: iron ABC transporter permease [Planctomycetota bacterium]
MTRRGWILIALGCLSLLALAYAPLVGPTRTPWEVFWQEPSAGSEALIFWKIRLPRAGVAYLAGAALALSGMTFQGVFRNPLATPFTLGVASGASLGASLYVHLGRPLALPGAWGMALAAFGGALLAMLLVYGLTRLRQGFSTTSLLLAGVAVSFFFSSLIVFIQYVSTLVHTFQILRWLMGSLDGADLGGFYTLLPLLLAGGAIVFSQTRELNLLTTGEELASSRGMSVQRTKTLFFFAASLMVGGVVAVCGPIGFVGMMAPHICRLLIGPDHRALAPATLLFGGVFLTACDTLARMAIPLYNLAIGSAIDYTEIPVGVVTALLGGPFFLWLLVRRGGAPGA